MLKSTGVKKINIAVFISGTGTNFKNLIQYSLKKQSKFKIKLVVSNNLNAKGLEYAKKFKIKKKTINYKNLKNSEVRILNDLNKVKTLKIFKWLKKNNISDKEMLKTFNCGVGFCLIVDPKKLNKVNRFFSREFEPYVIGKITRDKKKVKLNAQINWD